MASLNIKSKTSRTLIAAALIGASLMAATPSQAAGTVGFGFNFSTGNGMSFSMGTGNTSQKRSTRQCMDNRYIGRQLSQNGFSQIKFGRDRGQKVQVQAQRGSWDYSMTVDRCTGTVSNIDRDRHQRRDHRQPNRGGLNLQFNFN